MSYATIPGPLATTTTPGLQSAQGKRIELQNYEDCAGQVVNSATWNPASFVAADVGLTTVAAGTRLFCQTAGGSCVAGVYVATSATAATLSNTGADSVRQGAKLKVITTTSGPVEYWQTAATDATAVFVMYSVSAFFLVNRVLADGDIGVAYTQTVKAQGGSSPCTYSIVGSLPAGLSLNSSTGLISGTPTMAQTVNVGITATSSSGSVTSKNLSLTIHNYSEKLKTIFGSSIVGWWKQSEPSGTTAYDSSQTASDGTYSNVTLAQSGIGDGLTSALFTRSPISSENGYTTALLGKVNTQELTMMCWAKVADVIFWTAGGNNECLMRLQNAAGSHLVDILHAGTSLAVRYFGAGKNRTMNDMTGQAGWFHVAASVSVTRDNINIYCNGILEGSETSAIGTWTDALADAMIGNNLSPSGVATFAGYVEHAMVLDREATAWEVQQAANLPMSGVWAPQGVVMEPATALETTWIQEPNILYDTSPQLLTGNARVFKLWYSMGNDVDVVAIAYAESTDCIHWTKHPSNPIINGRTRSGGCVKVGGLYYMTAKSGEALDMLSSSDGVHWSVVAIGIVPAGIDNAWDVGINNSCLLYENGTWYIFYDGSTTTPSNNYAVGFASSTDGVHFTKYSGNPVLQHATSGYDINGEVGGPFVHRASNGTYYMWCQCSPIAASGPTDLIRFHSTDRVTWAQDMPLNSYPRHSPYNGWFSQFGQVSDCTMCEVNGITYMIYAGLADGGYESHFELATAQMGFDQLVETYEGIAPGYKMEMLINPSFEIIGAGGADIWRDWTETAADGAIARTITVGEVHADSSRIAACKLTAGSGLTTNVSQRIDRLIPRATYVLSGYSRGDGTHAGRLRIQSLASADLFVFGLSTGTTSATYAPFSFTFIAPLDGSVTLGCYCPETSGGIAYFDDLSVRQQ